MATPIDDRLLTATVSTARRWAARCRRFPEPGSAKLLAKALQDLEGLPFILDFVDSVLRPDDAAVAARALRRLAETPPPFLPPPLRAALQRAVPLAPRLALPAARRVFEALVGDLVVDHSGSLRSTLRRLARGGRWLNVNLLGEAVLGDRHANARLSQTMGLLDLPEVDYVSLKVSSVLGPRSVWGHDAAVKEATARLRPLFEAAAARGKFVNLDMEEHRDLHLTLETFERLLALPGLEKLSAGIVVQTYLRESSLVLDEVDRIAARRAQDGGAPVKVRLVKGANLAMERVGAELHGWENPVLPSKADTDASFLHALDRCLRPDTAARLRVGVASHNVFSLAAAWELARERGVGAALDLEMLSGMGVPLQHVLMEEVGRLRLYVPVVARTEYDSAISYLVRRLEENAAPENFMAGAVGLGDDPDFLDREEARFRDAAARTALLAKAWSKQTREEAGPGVGAGTGFANAVDTDPALPANQRWADRLRRGLPAPELAAAAVEQARVEDDAGLEAVLEQARAAGGRWADTPASERAALLHAVGEALESARGSLVLVAADEAGKLFDQADVEVSEACDFANYYASQARVGFGGASQVSPTVTVVAPPWNFPIAIPLGGVAAALAVGSAVILKPAPPARRIGALLAETLWSAGVPRDLLQLVIVDDGEWGRRLITDERVGQVVLTGAAETAELFRSWRPDLPLLAETSGKNAIVVTPSADLDLAAADLVASAFGHAGQKCSAASLGILVGSVAASKRFLDQLVDATASLRVGAASDPAAQLGPLTEPPSDKLQRALTTLSPGETWLLSPRRLAERLWSPGIRTGVLPGSDFHQIEYFGPVLGLMAAPDLATAIGWQNGTRFGLTAGLHSLDPSEVQQWLDGVEAGNLYVNRTITGAIVRRQPFGGWKASAVGTGAKAGGPNHLLGFGTWRREPERQAEGAAPSSARLVRLLQDAAPLLAEDALADLREAAASDDAARRGVFGALADPSALHCELNVLRYVPAPVTVRVEDGDATRVLREASAAVSLGAAARFSFRGSPDAGLQAVLERAGFRVEVASDGDFDQNSDGRIRHLGTRNLSAALGSRISASVFQGPTLRSGRLAGLPYVREQAVSVTAHRFGHPSALPGRLRLRAVPDDLA